MYIPHLLKEVEPIGAQGTQDYRAAIGFQPLDPARPNPKILPIPEDINHAVVQGMWSVVNGGGTGAGIQMAGFDIAGKTGTAQVVALGKDTGKNKDHSWFMHQRTNQRSLWSHLLRIPGLEADTPHPQSAVFTIPTTERPDTKNRQEQFKSQRKNHPRILLAQRNRSFEFQVSSFKVQAVLNLKLET
jgi:hypothetical protein